MKQISFAVSLEMYCLIIVCYS